MGKCIAPRVLSLGSRWRWVASWPSRFNPEEIGPHIHWIGGWEIPSADLDAATEKCPFIDYSCNWTRNLRHYTNWATPSGFHKKRGIWPAEWLLASEDSVPWSQLFKYSSGQDSAHFRFSYCFFKISLKFLYARLYRIYWDPHLRDFISMYNAFRI
jgi:hypothetical protein